MRIRTGAYLPTVLLALIVLGSYLPNSYARSSAEFGQAVDDECTAFNGTTPFGDQSCALCHESNTSTRVDPEWEWWETGNLTAFCPEEPTVTANQEPDGTIDTPAADQIINIGDSVAFAGTGSDPEGDLPLTFNWDFGDGAQGSNAADAGSVIFDSAGTFSVTFTVTDSLGMSDSTPASRTITVNDPNDDPNSTCTDADNDGFALEGGSCGAIDCDDSDTAINPDAPEICSDSVDNNCNDLADTADPGAVDCQVSEACFDNDGDQFSPDGGICGPIDCDDFDAAANPGAAETCDDGIDNDCNSATDEEDPECNGGDCFSRLIGGDGDNTQRPDKDTDKDKDKDKDKDTDKDKDEDRN